MHRMIRTAAIAPLAAVLLVGGLSGCHWFKKKNALYTQSGEARPLEVPPDLDRPSAERAMELPVVKPSAMRMKLKFWLIHKINSSLMRLM